MTRVLKLGGRTQGSTELLDAIVAAWTARHSDLCLVHGGGDEISALQRALGIEPLFVGGRRATTARDLELVRMALSGGANKRLVTALVDRGVAAWGISGEDAGLLQATPLQSHELGLAGEPAKVNAAPLRLLLERGYLPVVSPLARNAAGTGALNVNGDDAAAALAAAIGAEELVFVSDVAGVAGMTGDIHTHLSIADARELIAAGVASGGMAAKLEAAGRALEGGVRRVRIAGIAAINDSTAGTVIAVGAPGALV
ncbi:acetylglutamate kinase [soil metagenome]